jgi:uncharacterized protein (UPF0332 family)
MPSGYHYDLLKQARQLLSLDPGKPRQASLKRAVSTAYYALFHLLIKDGAASLLSTRSPFYSFLSRSFTHADMKAAAAHFRSALSIDVDTGKPPSPLSKKKSTAVIAIPQEFRDVAEALVHLQQSRHSADYDVRRRFTRHEAGGLVAQAEAVFVTWRAVRKTLAGRFFLLALLVGNRSKGE